MHIAARVAPRTSPNRRIGGEDEQGDPDREEDVRLLREDGERQEAGHRDRAARREGRVRHEGGGDEHEAHRQRVDARDVEPCADERVGHRHARDGGEAQHDPRSSVLRVGRDHPPDGRAPGQERHDRNEPSRPVVQAEEATDGTHEDEVERRVNLCLHPERGIAVEGRAGVKRAPGLFEAVSLQPLDVHRIGEARREDPQEGHELHDGDEGAREVHGPEQAPLPLESSHRRPPRLSPDSER